jgi:hypothetical protein
MNQVVLHVHLLIRKGFQEGTQLHIIIPPSMVKQMVKDAHDSKIVGHMGIFKKGEQI